MRTHTRSLGIALIVAAITGLDGCGGGARTPRAGRSTGFHASSGTVTVMGSTATGRHAARAGRRPAGPASCPDRSPARSSTPGRDRRYAPGDPIWTTVCVYAANGNGIRSAQHYAGGPLDRVLNSTVESPPSTGQSCGGRGSPPMVALLRYASGPTRRVVIDFARCALVRANGSRAYLPISAWGPLTEYYAG